MGDSYRLPGIVLEASSSKTWDIAVSEWHVVGCHDNGNTSGECLCGHEGIRYEFTIKNSVNGKELSQIGSTCILKFENDELKNEVEGWKAAIKLLEALEARKPGVRLDGMNRDLVETITSSWWICSTRGRHRRKSSARRCTWC